jgi:hypothetical protein
MAKALEIWSPEAIQEALGDDADAVLPEAVRLAEIRVRLPRYRSAQRSRGSWTALPVRIRASCRGSSPVPRMLWRGRIPRGRNCRVNASW